VSKDTSGKHKELYAQRKAADAQRKKEIEQLTGLTFSNAPGSDKLWRAIDEQIRKVGGPAEIKKRTGLKPIGEDEPAYPLECSAEFHFARFTGMGATLAPLVYGVMMHVAKTDGVWWMSMQKLARYLGQNRDEVIYAAVDLLVKAGFLKVAKRELGAATHYEVVGHKEWAAKYPGYCICKEEKFPWPSDSDEAPLGVKLYAITGMKYFENVLKGWRKTGLTDEEICACMKRFIRTDGFAGSHAERRKAFGLFLRDHADALEESNNLPRKAG
jgi:hypothetical protein